MGHNSSRDLGSHTFHSFTEGFEKFATVQNPVIDPFGEDLLWRVQYGEGEVNIAVTTDGVRHFVVFSFVGRDTTHIFVYDSGHGTMDASQANGMPYAFSGEQDNVTFVFSQPKELTPLGTAELDWTILADWIDLPQGYPVTISVIVTPVITSTTSSPT